MVFGAVCPMYSADQVVPHGVDQMALFAGSRAGAGVPPSASATVVFPVPGGPVKHMCRLGRGAERPNLFRARFTRQKRRDLLYLPLHRHQPDQVPVEGIEDIVDVCRAPLGREGDCRVRRQGRCLAAPALDGPRGPRELGALRRLDAPQRPGQRPPRSCSRLA